MTNMNQNWWDPQHILQQLRFLLVKQRDATELHKLLYDEHFADELVAALISAGNISAWEDAQNHVYEWLTRQQEVGLYQGKFPVTLLWNMLQPLLLNRKERHRKSQRPSGSASMELPQQRRSYSSRHDLNSSQELRATSHSSPSNPSIEYIGPLGPTGTSRERLARLRAQRPSSQGLNSARRSPRRPAPPSREMGNSRSVSRGPSPMGSSASESSRERLARLRSFPRTQRSRPPERQSQAPERQSQAPEYQSQAPERQSQVPERQSQVPERQSQEEKVAPFGSDRGLPLDSHTPESLSSHERLARLRSTPSSHSPRLSRLRSGVPSSSSNPLLDRLRQMAPRSSSENSLAPVEEKVELLSKKPEDATVVSEPITPVPEQKPASVLKAPASQDNKPSSESKSTAANFDYEGWWEPEAVLESLRFRLRDNEGELKQLVYVERFKMLFLGILEKTALEESYFEAANLMLEWLESNESRFQLPYETAQLWKYLEPILVLKKKHLGS